MLVSKSFKIALFFLVLFSTLLFTAFIIKQKQELRQHADTAIPLYDKFELSYPSASYNNPNDPSIVDIEAIFTSPTGKQLKVPGFYFQDYTRSGSIAKETLTPTGSPQWKVRFAPAEVGTYSYTVTLKDVNGTKTLGSGTFTAAPSPNPGFLRTLKYHFQFDNGKQFIPVGINAPWFQPSNGNPSGPGQWGDGTYGVDAFYNQMQTNGVNFHHVWTCAIDSVGQTPWAKPNIGCDGSDKSSPLMNQSDSWDMDYMVSLAQQKGIYLMPILKYVDQTNFTAADQIKSRYFVARWGYATSIIAWDFNKEGGTDATANHNWTSYMSSIDPYHHLRSTSQWDHYPTLGSGNAQAYNQIFADSLMDIVQNHDYTSDCDDVLNNDPGFQLFMWKMNSSDPRNFYAFTKPSFYGETGVDSQSGGCGGDGISVSSLYNNDKTGKILKSELWGSLMGSSGAYAPWFYKFDNSGAWTQLSAFKGVAGYAKILPEVPDDAKLFTSYNDTSQTTVSNANVRVTGRKNMTFGMFLIQNITGTALPILRSKTPTPVSGTITLNNMKSNTTFSIQWINTDTGGVIKSESHTTDANGIVVLSLPQTITDSIAGIITQASPVTSTPSTTQINTPTTSSTNTSLSVTMFLHGIGKGGDNANPNGGGNSNPLHPQRVVKVFVYDAKNTLVSTKQGTMIYNNTNGNFTGTIDMGNIPTGKYLLRLHTDGFLDALVPGIYSITQGQRTTLPNVISVTGDANSDNQLDIQDYNMFVSCFGRKSSSPSCTSQKSDFNDDGAINAIDYNLFIREISVQKGQ
ncbi:MAG TPA: DUF5060 domain-containing protein [Candidatus Saccharimonadales bacterium]|nr:DUF5060 domain-containing protein [Candidatus Saccharimonadales bacterium]